jgi:rhodanese-related sulfurtransferase
VRYRKILAFGKSVLSLIRKKMKKTLLILTIFLAACSAKQEEKQAETTEKTEISTAVAIPENTKGMSYEERSLKAENAAEAIKNEGLNVIDVRSDAEFAQEHFENAQSIPYTKPEEFVQKVKDFDKSKKYLVHCAAGAVNGRSFNAAKILDSLGFEKVYNLKGGYMAFKNDTTSAPQKH